MGSKSGFEESNLEDDLWEVFLGYSEVESKELEPLEARLFLISNNLSISLGD